MKGEEFRNLLLFHFPHVISSIEHGPNEQKIWLVMVFQVRAYVLPDNEYQHVSENELAICNEKFITLYEMVYGMNNASYNVHMVCHMKEIRSQGKLTDTSTFPQESYYGEMRNSYVTGTCSTGKQLLQHAYLKRQLPHSKRRRSLRFRDKKTSRTDDTLIYIFENGAYKFYKIIKIQNDGQYMCHRIGKRQFEPQETAVEKLKWETVGVFKFAAFTNQEITLSRNQISGKAIIVKDLIMTCPTNVLQE